MAKLVRLKHQTGQFWDSRLGWGIKLDEVQELPENIPAGSLLAERLRMGAFVEADHPQEKLALEAPAVVFVEEKISPKGRNDIGEAVIAEPVISSEQSDERSVPVAPVEEKISPKGRNDTGASRNDTGVAQKDKPKVKPGRPRRKKAIASGD